jgi:hypothetical protein
MKENWNHIFNDSACPQAADLELYHAGKLPEEKRFAIENHLADCELCSDYLEGLALLPESVDLDKVERELNQDLHTFLNKKQNKKRVIPLVYQRLAIAASILLVLGLTVYFSLYQSKDINQVAQQVEQKVSEPVETGVAVKTEEAYSIIVQPEQNTPMDKARPTPILTDKEEIKTYTDTENEADIEIDEIVVREEFSATKLIEEEQVDMLAMPGTNRMRAGKVGPVSRGVVSDPTGEAIVGATIRIKNRDKGTISGEDGSYELAVQPGDSLQFNFIGYEPVVELAVTESTMNITLLESNLALNEVVVVGYGTVKKREVTAAVSSVSSSKTKKISSQERRELEELNQHYGAIPDSLKNEWMNSKYKAEVSLILQNSDALVQLQQLLELTQTISSKDSIKEAITWVEKNRYEKARKLISPLDP